MTIVERVLLLQRVEVFGGVTTEQLSYIAMIAEEITARAGKVLYRENDPPDGLYIVISGTIAAWRGGEVVDRIRTDGSFGVWALFDDRLRLTSAETEEDSRLLFVPREQFYEVLSNHVDIVQGLFKQLVQRLHQLATILEK
jgi:CRP/FNR family cyclic AMP-dependent transcriptional regulator